MTIPTGESPGFCIPKLFINAKVSKRGLKQFINRQRLAIAYNSPVKDALLILDDCFDHPGALDNAQAVQTLRPVSVCCGLRVT